MLYAVGVVANGRRLFGQQGASPSGSYNGNGISVQYRKSGPEKIHIVGPTASNIQIQVSIPSQIASIFHSDKKWLF